MFERYTAANRKAIYFAREAALHDGVSEIDSHHLLLGLLREPSSHANSLFRLNETLSAEAQRQQTLPKYPEPRDVPLTNESKRILAYTAEEANQLDHYWIGTEHLVLGILRESRSSASRKLKEVGIRLTEARHQIADRPAPPSNLGPVPETWHGSSQKSENRWRKRLLYALLFGALIGLFVAQYYLLR